MSSPSKPSDCGLSSGIETTAIPGSGKFNLTGSLGDVISESAHVAFAWVRAHAFELGIAAAERENAFKATDVHLHMPAGAVKKDGPSAGVAMTVAIVSLSESSPDPTGEHCSAGEADCVKPPPFYIFFFFF